MVVRWEQFDKNYLSKLLLRKSVYRKSELWEAYQKINIRDAISVIDQVGGVAHGTPTFLSDRFVCDIIKGHVAVLAGRQRADLGPAVSALHGQQGLLPRSHQRHQLPVSHVTLPLPASLDRVRVARVSDRQYLSLLAVSEAANGASCAPGVRMAAASVWTFR